ncbi:MAG TPA: RHS repeat-associated core domain-containing protein [Vicinamibacterales bacterium]|nr:RHS repeat-associated core domain-containing protein [Vicinamibacterales bacterium]
MRAQLLVLTSVIWLLTPSALWAQTEVVEYYAVDTLGTVRVVFDQNGTVTSRRDYEPFGAPVTPVTSDPKVWAGLFHDEESGLEYAQARMYRARIGRFLSVDPVQAGLFNPQKWNRYSYALSSPLTVVDPDGLDPCPPGHHCETVTVTAPMPNPLAHFWRPPIYGELPISIGPIRGPLGGGGQRNPSGEPPGNPPGPPEPGPNPPGPNPPTPPEEPKDDCRVLSRTLSTMAAGTPLWRLPAQGAGLVNLSRSRFFDQNWSPAAVPTGFRPELVSGGQNYQAFRHVLGSAGSVLVGGTMGVVAVGLQTARDYRELRGGSLQAPAEIRGNLAGLHVADAMIGASLTGDARAAQQRISSILCTR